MSIEQPSALSLDSRPTELKTLPRFAGNGALVCSAGNSSWQGGLYPVTVNEPLFDFEPKQAAAETSALEDNPIRHDQVVAIREAFAAAGIDSQERRQEIAQSCVVRPVGALRELTAAEAHRVLKRINEVVAAEPTPEGASAWDLRGKDTWIDKL